MEFIYYAPLRIVYAKNSINKIAQYTARNGSRVLLVTGKKHLKNSGILDKVLELFKNSKKIEHVTLFNKAEENPDTDIVNEAASLMLENNLNVVVGIGGGSTMDLSKAASISAKQKMPIEVIMNNPDINIMEAYPIICSPTTSGSGSEVTKYTVINNIKEGTKRAIGSETIYPKVSLIDPTLTYSMGKSTIANTGFDALSHAIEAYTSNSSSPITDAYCRQAISLISENLEPAYKDHNEKAMDNMSLAAMLSGMALNVGRASLPHAMEHSLSAYKKDLPHGLGLSMILGEFVEKASSCRCEKFADIAYLMGEDISNMTLEKAAKKAKNAIDKLKQSINLNHRLSEFGFNEEILNDLVKDTFWTMEHGINNSPCNFTKDDVLSIYKKSL
jgi:alcohol dehydrogenase class IV